MPKIPTVLKRSTKLSVYDFGQQLLETNDLDPIYVMLWEAKLPKEKLQKWLLSYWCHYHSGTASWTVDQKDYWQALFDVAGSKEYPRSMERRHFRGNNALKSVTDLCQQTVAERLNPIMNATEIPATDLMSYVRQWNGFGPWIAFKVADMIERLDLARVKFDVNNITIFDSPREGAELLYQETGNPEVKPTNIVRWAVGEIINCLGDFKAPPRYERGINIQEAETVLCKWKSYRNGHYKVGEDIESLKRSLRVFDTPTNLLLRKVVHQHLGEKSA